MNHKLSKLVLGLAAVCAFSGQAMAANQTFQEGAFVIPTTFGFYDTEVKGTFTDNYLFSVGSSSFSSSVTSATLGNFYNINGLTATLIQTATSTATTGTTVANGSAAGSTTNVVGVSLIAPVNLAAGYYDLQITGTATGSGGGTYGGGLNISPVPEPTEGALLLSGLGLMGFIAARRRS